MKKVDMHVHSSFSNRPSEWFLQRIGAQESYTEPETVYRLAKSRGMTYVTLTDHNTIEGALRLRDRHPDDTFVSSEVTTYFPENDCKIHVLVYDITESQFEDIQQCRRSIYELRDYLRGNDILSSVAHATFAVNGRLSMDILEKLILLFDVFEGINGARSRLYNTVWLDALQSLTPADLDSLRLRHGIEPWGGDSWIKGFTGGSDDHAGLLIGETYTSAPANSLRDWLEKVRAREARAEGRHGDHRSLAFSIYKIAYDYSLSKTGGSGLWKLLNVALFDEKRSGLGNWIAMQRLKRTRDDKDQIFARFFEDLVHGRAFDCSGEVRVGRAYDRMATLSDEFLVMVLKSIERDVLAGDIGQLMQNISAALPAAFLTAPFFTTMRHLHRDRTLISALRDRLGGKAGAEDRRVLWFSDTFGDLNGVSTTLHCLAREAQREGRSLQVVTCLAESQWRKDWPATVANLPCIHAFKPSFYPGLTLHVPSVLKAMDWIARQQPDEIVISTPGPVGLVGLLAARLLDVKCTGVFHTDFTRQVSLLVRDEMVTDVVEAYTMGFFRMMDEVRVPTGQYRKLLAERGLDPARMKTFRRGIEAGFAEDDPERQATLRKTLGLMDGDTLVYAGRMGRDKNLDFLMKVYDRLITERPEVNLLLLGDGPEMERLGIWAEGRRRIVLAGRVDRFSMPHYYRLGDVFVFPSETDTFGMAVLEAQACGLPAIVSNVGGPQELVVHGQTGFVVSAHDVDAWVQHIGVLLDLKVLRPNMWDGVRRCAETLYADRRWADALNDIMGPAPARGDVEVKAPAVERLPLEAAGVYDEVSWIPHNA